MNTTSNNEIPYFEDAKDPMVPGKPLVERNTIQAIILNKETNEVLCLEWPEFDWKTFVIGGIEEGEDLLTTAQREITEETGYVNVKFIGEVGKTRSAFYAAHKGVNRIANATGMLFELIDLEQKEVSAEETKNHSYHWIPFDEVSNYINIDSQLYMWQGALKVLGK